MAPEARSGAERSDLVLSDKCNDEHYPGDCEERTDSEGRVEPRPPVEDDIPRPEQRRDAQGNRFGERCHGEKQDDPPGPSIFQL